MLYPTPRQSTRWALAITCVVLLFLIPNARASHIAGAHLTYECLGNNQYEVYLTVYRDCSGVPMGTSPTLFASSSCGTGTVTVNMTLDTVVEVSNLCDSLSPFSTCNNGFLPGLQEHSFFTTVTLSPACNAWTLSWDECCTNGPTNTSGTQTHFFTKTIINTANGCSDAPQFQSLYPIPSVSINQPATINASALPLNGDSLVYSLMDFYMGVNTVATNYVAPAGAVIDSTTGLISWTPTTLGNYMFNVRVDQYSASGVHMGWVEFPFEVYVLTPSNAAPVAINPGPVTGCTSQNNSFTVGFADPDSLDSLSYTTNVLTLYPGAVITDQIVNDTLWVTVNLPQGTTVSTPQQVLLSANDDNCPAPNVVHTVVPVDLTVGVTASNDVVICGPQTAQLSSFGSDSLYTWTSIAGDPLVVGTNFSCNPCQNPVASPSQTTTYVLTGTSNSGCSLTDTVTVTVTPSFTSTLTAPTTCYLSPVQVATALSPPGNYSFSWSPANVLDDPQAANPVASFTGNTPANLHVTITDPNGCVQQDSITVSILNVPGPYLTTTAQPPVVYCAGDSVQLETEVDTVASIDGAFCQVSSAPCTGVTMHHTVGTGTQVNGPTLWPSPYGGTAGAARHQMMIRASELIEAGVQPGNLTSLAMYVETVGTVSVFNNFSISIGCTTASYLPGASAVVSSVFPAQTVTITPGWNTHQFAQAYVWDGVSNLIVDMCFVNGTTGLGNGNAQMRYTSTSYNSTLRASGTMACTSPSSWGAMPRRPNMRFGQCGTAPNLTDYTYTWAPAALLDNPHQAITGAAVPANTTYMVTVTDTTTGCWRVDTVLVPVDTLVIDGINNINPSCFGDSNGTLEIFTSNPWVTGYSIDGGQTIQPGNVFPNLPGGVYPVRMYSSPTCFIEDTGYVNPPPEVFANATANSNTVCEGQNVTLTAMGSGGIGSIYTYSWSTGQTTPQITVGVLSPSTYQVTVTDVWGCSDVDTLTVDIFPDLVSTVSPDTWLINGNSVQLCASASAGAPPYQYLWSTFQNDSCITVTPGSDTTYWVSVQDMCNNETDTISVLVAPVSTGEIVGAEAGFSAFPNPYREGTTLAVTTEGLAQFELEVLDLLGRRVEVLANGTFPAGEHRFEFRSGDLPQGTYLARLTLNGSQQVIRLMQLE